MIEANKRNAIYLLHQEGMSLREIAAKLGVSRNSVRSIILQQGVMPASSRQSKAPLDPELLQRLYRECDGRIQRVHEKLIEEEKVPVSYSSLTRRLRQLGISRPQKERCAHVPDEPGAEMQHDTTVYQVELGGQRIRVVASLLYLRYSKRRYLKFYRSFNRFKMQCFFHEALCFWGYAAGLCIIDNTNLARLSGTGPMAKIVPEMAAFARQYGFEFRCHALKHANRKAGDERSFATVETNFLAGRNFQSMEDLNEQGFHWATERMEHRPQGKARIIPAKAFEHECAYLAKLPPHVPAPYRSHIRFTDQYGYVAFEGNYYWVPGTGRGELKVLEFADRLKLCRDRQCLAEYPLPADGVRNQSFSPEGGPAPRYQPKHRKHPGHQEEKRLRAMGAAVSAYLDFTLQVKGLRRPTLLRQLLALSRRMSPELFAKSIERAHRYRITRIEIIERIAQLQMTEGLGLLPHPEVDEEFQQRAAYQEGCLTELPDLSIYDQLNESSHEPDGQ